AASQCDSLTGRRYFRRGPGGMTETSEPDDTLWLAGLLAFPIIGFEQGLHTTPAALASLPLYQLLHWLSHSLLALPLAAAAVWSGHRLARRSGHRTSRVSDAVAHALCIALVFALLLVPGEALHEAADTLTHAHTTLAIHSHGAPVAQAAMGPGA